MVSPLTTAIIAMSMGRATAKHYYDLVGAFAIAESVTELVHRHRHLKSELQPALTALGAIFDRRKQRTIPDAPWSATDAEIDDLELGVRIYEAMIKTTPGPAFRRAINRALIKIDKTGEQE